MLLERLALTSAAVAASSARNTKIDELAATLADLAPDEVEPAIGMLSGSIRQGRIGIGWATVARLAVEPASEPTLTINDLDDAFTVLAATAGPGSVAARNEVLRAVLTRATEMEHDLVRRLLVGEIRQGALAGVVTAAVARAAGVRPATLRRAVMLLGDLGTAATLALAPNCTAAQREAALGDVGLRVMRAVEPMLAATSSGVVEALADVGLASIEWKLDGARIQVHRHHDDVRIFTRNLNEVTDRLSGVVEVVRALEVTSVILDGEILGVDADAVPQAFQDTMRRLGTEPDAAAPNQPGSALQAFFFDVLHLDGTDLIDRPLSERGTVLDNIVGPLRIPAVITDDPDVGATALATALAAGHEGIMVKAIDGRYEAGRRGKSWRKVKPVHTFDLVVIGVERGSGRRTALLSNLHLGALDPATGDFVMVGKTFKGLTDETLAWQTTELAARVIDDDGYALRVQPELVIEIAIDGVQRSTRYPGGIALRFARVKGYRPGRTPQSADTIDTLRSLLP